MAAFSQQKFMPPPSLWSGQGRARAGSAGVENRERLEGGLNTNLTPSQIRIRLRIQVEA